MTIGKTVVAAVAAHTVATEGRTVAVFKPCVTGLDEDGEADHELLRRAAGSNQSDDEIAPYRYGPPASPHLAAALAGEEIDPARVREAAREAEASAEAVVCEGVGLARSCRSPATTWCAIWRSSSATSSRLRPRPASARSITLC